ASPGSSPAPYSSLFRSCGLFWDDVVPPHISACCPREVGVSSAVYDQYLFAVVLPGHGVVGRRFDRHGFTTPELSIGGDQQFGTGILHPKFQRFGGESTKD